MPIIPRHTVVAQACAATAVAHLRTYIELNAHALAQGMDGVYRLWLLARSLDSEGRGIVSKDALLTAMHGFGLNRLHLRRAKLHPKSTAFFSFHKHKLEYRSLEAVCLALGVIPGRSINIPTQSIANTEAFRATLYAAWMAGHDDLHISREKLSKLFNISADTQRRWERLIGVDVAYNVVELAPQNEQTAEPYLPRDYRLSPSDREDRCYTWVYKGKTYYRTVNGYQARFLERARLGNVRKVTRRVHSALPDVDHGVGTRRRVFFSSRTTPDNYQEQPGASMRNQGRAVDLPQGVSALWSFHPWRPVTRKAALC